ncbi:MAG: ABC transporter permease [Acidimicrobiales bacterium]
MRIESGDRAGHPGESAEDVGRGVVDRASELNELPTLPDAERGGRARRRAATAAPALIVLVILLSAWEAASRAELISRLVLPAPTAITEAFVDLFADGLVWNHLWATLYETLIGFFVGAGLAFVTAVLSSFWIPFRRTVSPYMIILQVTPRIALAPIFITWFGFGYMPKIVMAATICFFPVFINTLTGLLTVDEEALEMFRSMRASKRQIFTQLTLPSALPVTFAGLKTGVTLALIGAIVAEFVGTSQGLGLLIDRFNFRLAMESAFAVLLLLALLGLLLYGVMEYLDRRIVFWTHDERLVKKRQRPGPRRLREGS